MSLSALLGPASSEQPIPIKEPKKVAIMPLVAKVPLSRRPLCPAASRAKDRGFTMLLGLERHPFAL